MRTFSSHLLLGFLLLFTSCAVSPPREAPHDTRPSTIVVLHGLGANRHHVSPLTTALRSRGFRCLAPDLTPSDGSVSISVLAQQVEQFLAAQLPSDAPVQLIGHSMGGLAAEVSLPLPPPIRALSSPIFTLDLLAER